MAHYSSKPCSEEDCCCSGTITATECGINWEVAETTYALRIKKADSESYVVQTQNKSGFVPLGESGTYILEVLCSIDGRWIQASTLEFEFNILECCSASVPSSPSCQSLINANPDSPPFMVIIDNAPGPMSWINGTHLLDEFSFGASGPYSAVTQMYFISNPNYLAGTFLDCASISGWQQNWRCGAGWFWLCPTNCEPSNPFHLVTNTGGLWFFHATIQYAVENSISSRRCDLYRNIVVRVLQYGRIDGVCYYQAQGITIGQIWEQIPCTTDPWYIDASDILQQLDYDFPPDICRIT